MGGSSAAVASVLVAAYSVGPPRPHAERSSRAELGAGRQNRKGGSMDDVLLSVIGKMSCQEIPGCGGRRVHKAQYLEQVPG